MRFVNRPFFTDPDPELFIFFILSLLVLKSAYKLLLHVCKADFPAKCAVSQLLVWYLTIISYPAALYENLIDLELLDNPFSIISDDQLIKAFNNHLLVYLVSFHGLQVLELGSRTQAQLLYWIDYHLADHLL